MTNLSWDIGTAYDFFVSLHVLYHPEDYGLRRAWAAGVRSRLPTAEREALGEILEIMFPPVSWIYELPAPKDSATLLTHLARLPAAERLPSLVLGEHVPAAITERLQDIASRGSWNDDDQQYLQEFLKQYEERAPKRKTVHRALELWSQCERVGEQLLDGLKMFHAVFFAEEETRIQPVLRDAVVRSQKMASRLPLSELLDELAHGVSFSQAPETEELILIPSFWISPLVALVPYSKKQRLFLFGARPDSVSLIPGEVVPDMLYNALKALADPTRLRILRYLNAAPMTPADLARRLRLRPPTVTHHLRSLRVAGMIRLTIDANNRRLYAPRQETITGIYKTLQAFLESNEE
ncbi:MAG: winged helix-turn-helix transcriptional regulator [Ardenticatenales bacterium]|nr:winged helix-turn-helix transcriptional regulator [Ardenticatenales bacterium]